MTSYRLSEEMREKILSLFPPSYHVVYCDHITISLKDIEYPECDTIRIVGYAKDDLVETLVVEIDGNTIRPDGKIFHITLSTNWCPPALSNDLIAKGYEKIGPIVL